MAIIFCPSQLWPSAAYEDYADYVDNNLINLI